MSNDNSKNPYEVVLADLLVRRQQLDAAILAISELAGIDPPTGTASARSATGAAAATRSGRQQEPGIQPDSFFNMTVQQAITKCLGLSKKPLSASDITKRLEDGGIIHDAKNFYNSVYTALRRLKRSNTVVQLDNKDWGLAEWYPNKPRQKREAPDRNGAPSTADVEDDDGQDATDTQTALKAL